MLKISFWLKKSDNKQRSLEHITIDNPQKILEGKLVGMHFCQVFLSDKRKNFPIYSVNPADALFNASEFAKMYLQGLIGRGYAISEVESREPWKLEKADINLIVRERINNLETVLNDDRSISLGVKQELLKNLRKLGGIETKK